MCKVYIWKTKLFSQEPGHCALHVGGTYMSFWPGEGDGSVTASGRRKKRKKKGVIGLADRVNTYSESYEEDVEDCHGEADQAVSIRGLCHSSMARAWEEALKKPYNLKWFNCATAARTVLDAGFDGSTFRSPGDALWRGFKWMVSPFQTANSLLGHAAGDTMLWTPQLVYERALYIKRLVE